MTTADKPVRPLRRFVASLTIGTLIGGGGALAWGTTALAAEARAAQEAYRANVQVVADAHRAEAAFWQDVEQQAQQARAERHRAALSEAREDAIDHIRAYEGLAADTAGKVTDSAAHDALVEAIEELAVEAATAHMGELEGIRAEADELAAAVEESHAEWRAEQERIRQEEERRAREEAERQAAAQERAHQQATPTTTPSRSSGSATSQQSQPAQQQTRPRQAPPKPTPATPSQPERRTRTVADDIAARHGMTVVYDDAITGHRGYVRDDGYAYVVGRYESATPDVIYLSTSALDSRTPAALISDVTRHEVAHAIIYRTCGRVDVGGARFEQVTDAYAALYLGMGAHRSYGWTEADAQAARDIRAGRC